MDIYLKMDPLKIVPPNVSCKYWQYMYLHLDNWITMNHVLSIDICVMLIWLLTKCIHAKNVILR